MAIGSITNAFSAADLGRALEAASDEMKGEVGALIPATAERMAAALQARYPVSTRTNRGGVPHMRDDVRIRSLYGSHHLLPVRRVTGPRLAYIWQEGTVDRFDPTRANARRGRGPAHDPGFFGRTAAQTRAQFMQEAQRALAKTRSIV
jgi:hypothetical protein